MYYDKKMIAAKLRRWERYLRNYTLPSWEELPNLELYMDQVIALLTQYLDFLPHGENTERIVTASAINNYVRMKIMPAPSRKKYSRIHLAYLIMICTLKRSLSISYVQRMIPMGLSEDEVHSLYNDYVTKHKSTSLYFIEQIRSASSHILDQENDADNSVENLVSWVAVISGLSQLLAEKLIVLQNTDIASVPEDELLPKPDPNLPRRSTD